MSREIPPRITRHTPNWNASGTPRVAMFLASVCRSLAANRAASQFLARFIGSGCPQLKDWARVCGLREAQ